LELEDKKTKKRAKSKQSASNLDSDMETTYCDNEESSDILQQ
jgi:hypothetical protein